MSKGTNKDAELRRWYEENRARYLESIKTQQELFDKTLIFLSSGAVAGLVTVATENGLSFSIKLTICFFLLTILSSMISIIFSIFAHQAYCKPFDDNFKKDDYGKPLTSSWTCAVDITNIVSILCAIIGFICMLGLVFFHSNNNC